VRPYRRENGVYYVRVDGRRVSLKTTNRRTAEVAVTELERRRASPAYARAHAVTFADACAAFLRDAPTAGNRARPPAKATIEMWRFHVGHFRRLVGDGVALAAVDGAEVECYIAARRAEPVPGKRPDRPNVSAATVDKELSTLRKILTAAARRGEYHHPLDAVIPAKAGGGRRLERALTWPDEVERFFAALAAWPARRAICAFVLGLGADVACILNARCSDFDLDRGVVLLRGTKTARRHAEVPIVAPFGDLVREAYAWLSAHGRFPQWQNSARDLARICRSAGVPRVTLRDLRRTFGRVQRARGVPPNLIGAMLRHTDGRMAELHYAGIGAADVGRLVAAAHVTASDTEATQRVCEAVGNRRKMTACS
jgi:integrase